MSDPKPNTANNFAALTFELVPGADGVTAEAHLLPPGPFRSDDVRPVECAAWQLDAQIAARVIARAAARKTDTVIAYEHQDLHAKTNGQKVLAAGWIGNTYEWREGKGLYAVGIYWTNDAKREISAKQIRYISALFYYSGITGEVLEIVSVSVTNTPGVDGLEPLAALARAAMSRGELTDFSTTEGADMALTEQQVAALTKERDDAGTKLAALTIEHASATTKLAALTTENGELKSKVAGFEGEKAAAALAADKAKCTEMILAAMNVGSLTPSEKAYAEKKNLADLTEYLGTKKPLAMLTKQTDGKGVAGEHGLTEAEMAACTKANLTPEEFAKAK